MSIFQAQPMPPLPNLTRVGISSGNTLSLSLNDSIRRALLNSNDTDYSQAPAYLQRAMAG